MLDTSTFKINSNIADQWTVPFTPALYAVIVIADRVRGLIRCPVCVRCPKMPRFLASCQECVFNTTKKKSSDTSQWNAEALPVKQSGASFVSCTPSPRDTM